MEHGFLKTCLETNINILKPGVMNNENPVKKSSHKDVDAAI